MQWRGEDIFFAHPPAISTTPTTQASTSSVSDDGDEVMEIFIKNLSGNWFCETIKPSNTIEELKAKIQIKEGIQFHLRSRD